MSRDRANRVLGALAVAWTVALGLLWLVVPTSSTVTTTHHSSGAVGESSSSETLLEHEGAGVLVVLAVPVVVALAGAVAGEGARARAPRIGAGAVLLVACLVAAASIGLFYVPAAVLLLVAGARTPAERSPPAATSTV